MSASVSTNTDIFSSEDDKLYENTVMLRLPKFTKGYEYEDFLTTFTPCIGRGKISALGRIKYPNEWYMKVSTPEARNKLLKNGYVTVKGKKCVISPYMKNEVCGKVHWIPHDVPDNLITDILNRFGDVSAFENVKTVVNTEVISTNVRFFVMRLKHGVGKDDIPHFITIKKCEGLVTIKGREPMCFSCRGLGHRKADCPERKSPSPNLKNGKKAVKFSEHPSEAGASAAVSQTNVPKKSCLRRNETAVSQLPQAAIPLPTSDFLSSKAPESLSGVVNEVSNLQNIVNTFSQRLVQVLSTYNGTVVDSQIDDPSSSTTATGSKKKKKKKKKKSKQSGNYDVAAAAETSGLTNTALVNDSVGQVNGTEVLC